MLLNNLRRAWQSGRRGIRRHYYPIHGAVIGATRRDRYVADCKDGQDPCRGSSSAAVFCHYDRYGSVHDYVEYYLKSLRAAAIGVYFGTNAPYLSHAASE